MRFRLRLVIRPAAALLVIAGTGFAVREFRKTQQLADLPVATARKGEFLVLVRSRGQLMARRSMCLISRLSGRWPPVER